MNNSLERIKRSFSGIDKNTLLVIIEGSLGAIVVNLATPFYQIFAKRMGASDYVIGLVNSLPALLALFVLIPGSLMVDRFKDKKKVVGALILANAVVLPLIALTPFAGPYKIPLFVAGISILNIPFVLYTIAWQSLFSDIYKPKERNMPFANRTMMVTMLQTATIFFGGLVLSYLPKSDLGRIRVYQFYYLLAAVVALIQMKALMALDVPKQTIVKSEKKKINAFKLGYMQLRDHPDYAKYIGLTFITHVSWHMAWPMFFLYQFDYLHLNEGMKAFFDSSNTVAAVITCGFWAKYMGQKGTRYVAVIGMFGLAISPSWFAFSKSVPMAWTSYVVTGLLFPAFTLSIFQEMLRIVPEENKTLNIGIYNTVIALSAFISPLIGVSLMKATNIYIGLHISTLVRSVCMVLFIKRFWDSKKEISLYE